MIMTFDAKIVLEYTSHLYKFKNPSLLREG